MSAVNYSSGASLNSVLPARPTGASPSSKNSLLPTRKVADTSQSSKNSLLPTRKGADLLQSSKNVLLPTRKGADAPDDLRSWSGVSAPSIVFTRTPGELSVSSSKAYFVVSGTEYSITANAEQQLASLNAYKEIREQRRMRRPAPVGGRTASTERGKNFPTYQNQQSRLFERREVASRSPSSGQRRASASHSPSAEPRTKSASRRPSAEPRRESASQSPSAEPRRKSASRIPSAEPRRVSASQSPSPRVMKRIEPASRGTSREESASTQSREPRKMKVSDLQAQKKEVR